HPCDLDRHLGAGVADGRGLRDHVRLEALGEHQRTTSHDAHDLDGDGFEREHELTIELLDGRLPHEVRHAGVLVHDVVVEPAPELFGVQGLERSAAAQDDVLCVSVATAVMTTAVVPAAVVPAAVVTTAVVTTAVMTTAVMPTPMGPCRRRNHERAGQAGARHHSKTAEGGPPVHPAHGSVVV